MHNTAVKPRIQNKIADNTKNSWNSISNVWSEGFPGGSEVKNWPAKVGDTGSIPNLGRSHMQWSTKPVDTTLEPVL